MKKESYDVVVIGAGSAGLTVAVGFSKVGKRVLLIEQTHMGGECTNTGCIPSKALLHRAKKYHDAVSVAGATPATASYRAEAFTYVREIITEILKEETPEVFAEKGITVLLGEAEFTARDEVKVNDTVYHFKIAIIATGSRPREISVPGLAAESILTNQNLFSLTEIPDQTLVIGAGPIGLEMGQALALLGSEVTIATIDDTFAKLEDPAIRPILYRQLTAVGVKIECNTYIEQVRDGVAEFTRKEKGVVTGTFSVAFDKVLVAIGRVPNIPKGLELAGIAATDQGITIDSQYRTTNSNVYAIGDVSQRLKFTHVADDAARAVVTRVISRGLLRVKHKKAVPKVTYTIPALAQVGLSYEAAVAKYGAVNVMRIEVPFSHNDRAKTEQATDGVLVVIAKRISGTVLGAHAIGPAVGEIIALFTLAIDRKLSLWQLRSTIYAYPTYALVVKRAGDYFFAQQLSSLVSDLKELFRRQTPKLIALVFWITLIMLFQEYRISNNLSYSGLLLNLIDFFTGTMWGPIIYVALYTVRPLVLFPASLLTALSGTLFGFWWGAVFAIIGGNASANFAYLIGRFFGNDIKLENSVIGNWVTALRQKPFEAVLFMRLFYLPFDLVNYGAGLLKINWSAYFTASVIGMVPGAVTFVALGAALDITEFTENGLTFDAFDPQFLALSVVIFVVSLWLSRVLKQRHKQS